ncbi:hypothetical protein B0H13DRAFT_1882040 [Mycena leptocephala]|nr:hypothetical protein B0H13DRAFT_1882040 [Mycena leptocephala]
MAQYTIAKINVFMGVPKDDVQRNCDTARQIFDTLGSVGETSSLERLGNTSRWGNLNGVSSWTIVFLVHCLKSKEKLGIYKALQFLGDVILSQRDDCIGGVYPDGCPLQQNRMCAQTWRYFYGKHNMLKAVELWETTKLFFERSNQAKQVEHVNHRLTGVSENVLKQHRKILVHLAELNPLSGTIEDMDEIEDVEGLELGGGNRDLIVV